MDYKRIELAKQNKTNWQIVAIDEAQLDIKIYIRDLLLGRLTYTQCKNAIDKVIKESVKLIDLDALKQNAQRGLEQFANQQLQQCLVNIGVPIQMLLFVRDRLSTGAKLPSVISQIRLNPSSDDGKPLQPRIVPYKPQQEFDTNGIEKITQKQPLTITQDDKYNFGVGGSIWDILPEQRDVITLGVPNQEWDKEYEKKVKKELDRLSEEDAKEDGFSLRNKAEINVRDAKHKAQIDDFISKGIFLVICSTHSNCSKRCEKWQGKYYTLDNTYQEKDGIQFQPLQNATDIYYQTKGGAWYKNGLFGFNCRHYLIPYQKGLKPIPQSAELVEKQRELDKIQRQLERNVRKWASRMQIYQSVSKKEYEYCCKKYTYWYDYYIMWCKANKRVITLSRLKIYPYDVSRQNKWDITHNRKIRK